ncbi:MAG: response regulator [Verrucomicrobia bacterium]|jgi:signal transduction histidine kinase/ActR/RegA family two-component response regulator|nr:response regulator [Verrucomicrobiota bacterium]
MNERLKLIFNGFLIGLTMLALAAVNFLGYLLIRNQQQDLLQLEQETQESLSLAYQIQINFKIQVQEWKNVLLRGHRSEDFKKYFSQFEERETTTQKLCGQLLSNSSLGTQVRANIAYFKRRHAALGEAYRNALQHQMLSEPESLFRIDRSVRGIDRPPMDILDSTVAEMIEHTRSIRNEGEEQMQSLVLRLIILSAVCLVAAMLLVLLFLLDRRRYERQLSDAIASARKADEAKSSFLAHMSHEIRTPMNGIVAAVDLLHENQLSEAGREALTVMEQSAESLSVIVNDILDLSRIEAGHLRLKEEETDLHEILRILVMSLRPMARAKGLDLHCQADLPEKAVFLSDPVRLRQILTNLLSNAIKFTEEGRVDLNVALQPEEGDTLQRVRFVVRDTGIGIAPERQQEIFKAFVQLDDSSTRRHQGTGLGLVITKAIVDAMGGSIHLESEPGSGTTFTVCLSLAPAPPVKSRENVEKLISVAEKPLQKVLLVDDVNTNRVVTTRLLQRLECATDTASDGAEAVAMATRRQYDLILMDCQMPRMDGYEATRRIREIYRSREAPQPVIVAMTAHAMKEHRDECLQSGMDEHLTKPIRMVDLSTMISRFFCVGESSTRPTVP